MKIYGNIKLMDVNDQTSTIYTTIINYKNQKLFFM